MNPFEYVADINFKRKNVMKISDDPLIEKKYDPWLSNKAFSYYMDTIFLANTTNRFYSLPKKLQFDFLFHKVKPRKRFTKWNKSKKDKYRDVVKKYFDYGNKKADEALQILTLDNLKEIEQFYYEGGLKRKNNVV